MTIQHLYLFRHAQGLHNLRLDHGPQADIPLTEYGFKTVETLPSKVSDANFIVTPDVVMFSPLLRAKQTSDGLKPLYPDTPFVPKPQLREWSLGDVAKGGIMTSKRKTRMIQRSEKNCDPHWRANKLGETFYDAILRMQDFKQELFEDKRDSIICVGHGHFFQTLMLDVTRGITPTAEGMRAAYDEKILRNLDVVHLERNRETGAVAVDYRRFMENYQEVHPYPAVEQQVNVSNLTFF